MIDTTTASIEVRSLIVIKVVSRRNNTKKEGAFVVESWLMRDFYNI